MLRVSIGEREPWFIWERVINDDDFGIRAEGFIAAEVGDIINENILDLILFMDPAEDEVIIGMRGDIDEAGASESGLYLRVGELRGVVGGERDRDLLEGMENDDSFGGIREHIIVTEA